MFEEDTDWIEELVQELEDEDTPVDTYEEDVLDTTWDE